MLITVPPSTFHRGGRSSTTKPDGRYAESLRRAIAGAPNLRGLIYTSSTSVYGNGGGHLDEDAPVRPYTTSAQMVVQVERTLRAEWGDRLTVLRLGGLVGGQRDPARYFAARQDAPDPDSPVNLVHREDVVGAIVAVLAQQAWGKVYNIVAPEHPTRQSHYTFRAEQMGLEPPQFAREGKIGKLVSGKRIVTELDFEYQHPDPRHFPLIS